MNRRLPIIAAGASVVSAFLAALFFLAQGENLSATVPVVIGFAVPYTVLGAFLVVRGPTPRMGWTLFGPGATFSLVLLVSAYASFATRGRDQELPLGHVAGWFAEWSWAVPVILTALVVLLFPTGRPPTPRWRWVQTLLLVGTGAMAPLAGVSLWPIRGMLPTAPGTSTDQLTSPLADVAFAGVLLAAGVGWIAALVSLTARFRGAQDEERHQLKWFVVAAAVTLLTVVQLFILDAPEWVSQTVAGLGMLCLPVAMTVAILRYRLYDIDIVLSKTLVFGGLAGFITAIYVGIVVGIGTLLGSGDEPNLALSIVATAVVAVAFQPVRERLTRLANRLVFGKRATPYEVLSRFSEHLGEVAAPERTLERMARLLVEGTGAARAQVWLRTAGQLEAVATWPAHATDSSQPEHLVEVIHEGQTLGALSVDKQRGESLTPTDVKLVDDLAAQAGLVLRNLRLTEDLKARIVDLQASRQRLVSAQDQERRRLERDLHDGAQRQLVDLKTRLDTARATADREQALKAGQVLEQIAGDADDAVTTLRELAHGIYPPLLAAEGLAGALSVQASKAAVPVVVQTDGIGRYGQDVEAAVYFCVLEAVQNAAKYANPTQVTIHLSHDDGDLVFEVSDDGDGFDPEATPKGHGTTNMTDRLDALNGHLHITSEPGRGTRIEGRVPVAPNAAEVST